MYEWQNEAQGQGNKSTEKNANYVVILRIDNVQEHYENGSNCFCRPLVL